MCIDLLCEDTRLQQQIASVSQRGISHKVMGCGQFGINPKADVGSRTGDLAWSLGGQPLNRGEATFQSKRRRDTWASNPLVTQSDWPSSFCSA